MKGRSTCVLLSMLFFGMIVFGSAICHADTYHSVYDAAFEEAISRSDAYGGFENYNGLYYTMGDITGDGIDELIFSKSMDKHLGYFWVYGCSNSSSYYMGEVEEEAANQPAYGYKQALFLQSLIKVGLPCTTQRGTGKALRKKLCSKDHTTGTMSHRQLLILMNFMIRNVFWNHFLLSCR